MNGHIYETADFMRARLFRTPGSYSSYLDSVVLSNVLPPLSPWSSVSTAKTADGEAIRSFLVHFLSLPSSLTGPNGKLTLLGTWEPVLSSEESWVLEN